MSDLDALDKSFSSLGLDNANEVLERCGSMYGVRTAARDELEKENIGEAFGFLACGNAIVDRAVEEKRKAALPSSPDNAAVNAAALLWRGGNECLLSLDRRFNVDRVLRFRRNDCWLKRAVGFAATARVGSFIWVKRADDRDTEKQKRLRIKRVRRAMYLLKKIGIEALDYIECRRGRTYSAFAEKYVGSNKDKTPYPSVGRDNKIEVIKNGRAFRHGRNSRSDESGQLYQSVLQGAVR